MVLPSLLAVLLLQPGMAPDADITERQRELDRTRGTIEGRVTDAATGEPLEDVHVSAEHVGAGTDAAGAFRIEHVTPGAVAPRAERRDLVLSRQRVEVTAGRTVSVHVKMARAPRACCRLEGHWNITLILTRDWLGDPLPPTRRIQGTVRFSSATPDPLLDRRRTRGDPTVDEFGEYRIDLRPFFGPDFAGSASYTVFEGREGADLLTEAEGHVYNDRQVEINFIPRLSHGGLSLGGVIRGDSIRGTWFKREYGSRFEGSFVMKRARSPR